MSMYRLVFRLRVGETGLEVTLTGEVAAAPGQEPRPVEVAEEEVLLVAIVRVGARMTRTTSQTTPERTTSRHCAPETVFV